MSLVVGVSARPASAQSPAAPDRAKEQERTSLYREGLALAEAGRWDEALKRFDRVVAIRSAPPALVALATAQEKNDKLATAKRTFLRAREEARAGGDAELAEKAEKALAALEARIPRIVVVLPRGTSEARVAVDGTAVAADANGVEADPGEHHVVIEAAGRTPFQERFVLAAKERKEITVTFAPEASAHAVTLGAPSSVSSAPSSPDNVSAGPPLGSWILGTAGLSASVIGLIVRFNGEASYDEISPRCPDSICSSPSDESEANAARDRMIGGTIAASAGVGLLAGAGLWWILSSAAPRADKAAAGGAPISISPAQLRGGGAIFVRGAF